MKINLIIILLILVCQIPALYASQFEELDKPPEGAHEGQMLLGGFVSLGIPSGDMTGSEEDFVKDNTYTFTDIGVTKEMLLAHLSYDFGISFEYMPIDYVGIKTKLKRVIVVQRTRFGSDFQNWNKTLYSNFSFLFGPALHLTNRKQWDVTLTPVLGYTLAKYEATPIAAELIDDYTGDRERNVNGMTYGAELNATVYFSGGLYVSVGFDWNKYPLKFDPAFALSQPENENVLNTDSGNIQSSNLVLSVGYAFSN